MPTFPRAQWQAADTSAPKTGAFSQLTMGAAAATVEVDLGVDDSPTNPPAEFHFLSAVEFWIVFGPTGVAAPVIGASSAWGPLSAGTTHRFRVTADRRFFRVISTPGGSLAYRRASGAGQ